jgi:hypothetical protein
MLQRPIDLDPTDKRKRSHCPSLLALETWSDSWTISAQCGRTRGPCGVSARRPLTFRRLRPRAQALTAKFHSEQAR